MTATTIITGGIIGASTATHVTRSVISTTTLAHMAGGIIAATALSDMAGGIVSTATCHGRGCSHCEGGAGQQANFQESLEHCESPLAKYLVLICGHADNGRENGLFHQPQRILSFFHCPEICGCSSVAHER
jgi:hypothetical protein